MFAKSRSQQVHAFRNVPLFRGLNKTQLAAVARASTPVSRPAGTVLATEGRMGREFVLLLDGAARVERAGKLIGTLGPGGFFGEISLLDGKPRTATVIAETPCELLVVEWREFRPLLEAVPGLEHQMLLELCARVRVAYDVASA